MEPIDNGCIDYARARLQWSNYSSASGTKTKFVILRCATTKRRASTVRVPMWVRTAYIRRIYRLLVESLSPHTHSTIVVVAPSYHILANLTRCYRNNRARGVVACNYWFVGWCVEEITASIEFVLQRNNIALYIHPPGESSISRPHAELHVMSLFTAHCSHHGVYAAQHYTVSQKRGPPWNSL